MRLPPAVLAYLAEQDGVITREQCLAAGMSVSTIRTLLETERWQRVHRGVYVCTSGLISDDARIRAALLVVPKGILCNETLLWRPKRRGPLKLPIHVAVNPAEAPRRQAGICLHRLERLETLGSDPPRMSYERALLEVVHTAARFRTVEHLVCEVVGDRLTVPARLRAELERRPRQRWRKPLSLMLAEVAVGAQSPLELEDLRNDRLHGLPVGMRQVRQRIGGQGRWLDVVITLPDRPDVIVVKELDGRLGHESTGRFRDMVRDNTTAVGGGHPLHFGWGDVHGDGCETAAFQALLWLRLGVDVGASCPRAGCDLPGRVRRLDAEHPMLAEIS